MKRVIFAFDVDGTLIHGHEPRDNVIALLKVLSVIQNVQVAVWSGSGKDYAEMWVRRLDIGNWVWCTASKTEAKALRELGTVIAIDDMPEITIGDINLITRAGGAGAEEP